MTPKSILPQSLVEQEPLEKSSPKPANEGTNTSAGNGCLDLIFAGNFEIVLRVRVCLVNGNLISILSKTKQRILFMGSFLGGICSTELGKVLRTKPQH